MGVMSQAEIESLAARGQEIYDRRLKAILEPAHDGGFVAVDLDTEEHSLARRGGEALHLAARRFPGKVFFLARVGSPAAEAHRGRH